MSNKQDQIKQFIKLVQNQADNFYNIIKKQYPSENWLELTEAEQNMLLWFNDFETKHIQAILEANKTHLN